jgi:hypothetical protein
MTKDWRKPLKWNREAESSGERPRVFCASLADVFEDWQGSIHSHDHEDLVYRCQECGTVGLWPVIRDNCPACAKPGTKVLATMQDLRVKLFALIDATPWLDWLLLTKRPENIRSMWPRCTRCKGNGRIEMLEHCPLCGGRGMEPLRSNVWLGTSVENQEYAERRIPELLKCCELSPILFLSCEPLLGLLGLSEWMQPLDVDWNENIPTGPTGCSDIDWIIAGGESGPNARPTHPTWLRDLRDQCKRCEVPFHFKQWGEWLPLDHCPPDHPHSDGEYGEFHSWRPESWVADCMCDEGCTPMFRVGKKNAGRLLDGVEHNGFPAPVPASA